MIVRDYDPADAETIASIYAFHVANGTATFEIRPPTSQEMRERLARLAEANHPILIGVVDGEVIGFAYTGPYRSRPAYRNTVEDSIYLRNDVRSRGYGKELLGRLVSEATSRNFRQMIAVIGDSENRGSIALHASAGFAHVGTLKSVGFKHGRWLDSVLMQRALGAGDTTSAT